MAGHLGVNIDIAASVFRKGNVPLTEAVVEMTGSRSLEDMSRRGRLRERLAKELKGISVVTTHRGDMRQRFRIGSVSELAAADYTFEIDGAKMSMVEYFEKQYNYRVKYPWLPVIMKVCLTNI